MKQTIAFTNVSVLSIADEHILTNQNVVIVGETIAHVGDAANTPVPDEAHVIDGTSRFLMPGLADMHVHLTSQAELFSYLANGITTVRNMWGWPLHTNWREAIKNKELFGPNIVTSGPILDGVPPVWNGGQGVGDADAASQAVENLVKDGYDFAKIYSNLSPEVYLAVIKAAAENNFPVSGHIPFAVPLNNALDFPPTCNEHLMMYLDAMQNGSSPVQGNFDRVSRIEKINHIDENKIEEIAVRTAASGMWNCPTLVIYKKMFDLESHDNVYSQADTCYLSPLTRASWKRDSDFRMNDISEKQQKRYSQHLPFYQKMTKALYEADARLLIGSDSANRNIYPGLSLHDELHLFEQCGIPRTEVLRIATQGAAEYFGDESRGLVEQHKQADLLLLESNPLDDLAHLRKQVGVMVRGIWYDQNELKKEIALDKEYDALPDNTHWFVQTSKNPNNLVYNLSFNGTLFGTESVQLTRSPVGYTSISSTTKTQGIDSLEIESELIFDKDQSIKTLNVTPTFGLSKVSCTVRKSGEGYVLGFNEKPSFAHIKEVPHLQFGTGPLTMGPIPPLVCFYLWQTQLKSLNHNEERSFDHAELELLPNVDLVGTQVTIKRKEKCTNTSPCDFCFDVVISKRDSYMSWAACLDKSYDPLTVQSIDKLGTIVYSRVDSTASST